MFGLTEACKRTGIPARTIRGWAEATGLDITRRLSGELLDLPALPDKKPKRMEAAASPPGETPEIAPTNARAEEGETPGEIAVIAVTPAPADAADTLDFDARMRLKRAIIRKDLLDKIHEALNRMDEAHIEFFPIKDDVLARTYPKAPAVAFRAYAQAFATLFKEYRLEVGDATDRPEVTTRILDEVKGDHEREAIKKMIDLGLQLKAADEVREAKS